MKKETTKTEPAYALEQLKSAFFEHEKGSEVIQPRPRGLTSLEGRPTSFQ